MNPTEAQVPRPLQSRRSPFPATLATRPRERSWLLRSQRLVSPVKGLRQGVAPLEARRQRQELELYFLSKRLEILNGIPDAEATSAHLVVGRLT